MISQREINLGAHTRGYHLITSKIVSKIGDLPSSGLLNVFIKHTSCGLTINENADPSVRVDFESSLNHIVKEDEPFYTHTMEGSDDMPAHIKASLMGSSVTIPIINHSLALGSWQGIYLCEFRDHAGSRNIITTLYS